MELNFADAAGDLPEVIKAISALLQLLINAFGPLGSLGIVALAYVAVVGGRIYNDLRKDKEVNMVVAEKERTIQRMANIERDLRVQLLKERGWPSGDIERLVIQAEFDDPISARNALESRRGEGARQ